MLGECDADHGFRVLDYWARQRVRSPNARHVAVIVAEDLSGRYRTVIETLAQQLPFIAIEIRTLLVKSDPLVATNFPIIFAQPDDLVLRPADEPEGEVKSAGPNEAGRPTMLRTRLPAMLIAFGALASASANAQTLHARQGQTIALGPAEGSESRVLSYRHAHFLIRG